MASRFEDFLDATQKAETSADLNTLLEQAMNVEGYQNFVFAHLPRKTNVKVLAVNFPDGYHDMYFSRKYELIDPILRQTFVAERPFCWDNIAPVRDRSNSEIKFFQECRDAGVYSGITMPFHNSDRSAHLISVSLRDGPVPDPARIPFVYALAAQTWIRHCAIQPGNQAPEAQMKRLTARERECLSWAKDGKTNWEISQIISVAERTVEFHISNAMRKLNASNRIVAIVIAIQEGLIGL